MQRTLLNYRIIIEPEKQGKKTVYSAYCPTLGVADYGDSIDAVLKSIKDGLGLAMECLVEKGKEIPIERLEKQMIASAQVKVPQGAKLTYA